jgi:hypothetical protein
MFTIDNKITDLKIREGNIVKVFLSMNNHTVATPEMMPEEAKSYVFILREGGKRFSAFIRLHFLHTDRKLFYSYSSNPFSEDEMPDVEAEARYFAEDLGAMLDEMDFADLSDLEHDRWIEEQGIFSNNEPGVSLTEAAVTSKEPPSVVLPPAQTPQPAQPAIKPEIFVVPAQTAHSAQQIIKPEPSVASMQTPQPAKPVIKPEPFAAQARTVQPAPIVKPEPSIAPKKLAVSGKPENIGQMAAAHNIAKPLNQIAKKEAPSTSGCVSRDREALARLLASF